MTVHELEKVLTANDTGENGSHQAGIAVPKSIIDCFPSLPGDVTNPDVWLRVETDDGYVENWRYIHYNNKIVAAGTRDEFRLTHCRNFLRRIGATSGDVLVVTVEPEARSMTVSIRRPISAQRDYGGRLRLSTDGAWRRIAL